MDSTELLELELDFPRFWQTDRRLHHVIQSVRVEQLSVNTHGKASKSEERRENEFILLPASSIYRTATPIVWPLKLKPNFSARTLTTACFILAHTTTTLQLVCHS